MSNTIKNSALAYSGREAVIYVTLVSDGTEETDYIVYDSSAVATEIAKITPGFADPLTSRILEIYASSTAASTARIKLEWDADTDVLAFDVPTQGGPVKANFRRFAGLKNQAGTGITGDITLTTTGLESGDTIVIAITVGAY